MLEARSVSPVVVPHSSPVSVRIVAAGAVAPARTERAALPLLT